MSLHIHQNTAVRKADIANKCKTVAEAIEKHEDALLETLTRCESHETAKDEIWRTLDCLRNISKEIDSLSYGHVDLMCTFFPINLPLYSLAIFAIVPGFMAEKVLIRPPVLTRDLLRELCLLLSLKELLPHIKFVDMERHVFNEAFISAADVVLFTGRYQNAKEVHWMTSNALFVYNGAGVNPVIVTENADPALAAHKTIEMRLFNSGQDCAGSDIIFVHEKIADTFTKRLLSGLRQVKVGEYSDSEVRVGRIIKADQLREVQKFFDANAASIVYGGQIDMQTGIVRPTLIKVDIRDTPLFSVTEFFSPVFYVIVYHTDEDLDRYFSTEGYRDHAMYVSLFGKTPYISRLVNSVVLQDKIVNDVERGYLPYGGYGPKANYVSYRDKHYARPILISAEIADYLRECAAK